MASIVIPQWLARVFNPAVGGEYPDDRVALQRAMASTNTVPRDTVGIMRHHGIDSLTTDKDGNTFFMRDGKKIKVALPPDDVNERYTNRAYNVVNHMENLFDRVPVRKVKATHVDGLKYGFPM